MSTTRFTPRPALRWSILAACAFALPLAWPMPANAQESEVPTYRISQRAGVSQRLSDAVVSLEYSRPLVRGRTDLFGKVVHWGELWTPGANEATVLDVSEDVKLNGHTVPKGRWSMWIIPSRVGPWELVLDPADSLFHTERPDLTDEQIRFAVDVEEASTQVEALTWEFPRIAQDGATLLMSWGTTRIPIEVAVEPNTPVLTMSAADAAPYVGEWEGTFTPDPETGQGPPPTIVTLRHEEDGRLQVVFPPGAFGPPPGTMPEPEVDEADMTPQERERAEARRALAEQGFEGYEMVLVPRARGVFLMGWMQDGNLLDIEPIYHEFEFEGDRAVRLTIRNDADIVFLTGTRRNP